MAKIGIGNKIEDSYVDLVDEIHSTLGGNKFRIYEASIDLFNAMPPILQRALISYDDEERKLILDIISQLKPPPEPKKGGKNT
jgi:hypothetical protein